jgi:hypothetical protein
MTSQETPLRAGNAEDPFAASVVLHVPEGPQPPRTEKEPRRPRPEGPKPVEEPPLIPPDLPKPVDDPPSDLLEPQGPIKELEKPDRFERARQRRWIAS